MLSLNVELKGLSEASDSVEEETEAFMSSWLSVFQYWYL